MKNKIFGLCLVFIALLFTFTSCNLFEVIENGDYTEEYSSTDKEGSVELLDLFLEEILEDPNFVVTCTDGDGTVLSTETIKGTSSYWNDASGSKSYAYIKDGFYYVIYINLDENEEGETTEIHGYYCSDSTKKGYYQDSDEFGTMEDMYKGSYAHFLNKYTGFYVVSLLPEDNATFNCVVNNERKDGVTTGSLSFTYDSNMGSVQIDATSEENKIKTISYLSINKNDASDKVERTWSFVYGSASITLPDTDAWDREAAEEEARIEENENAINNRDEFFANILSAENITITTSIEGDVIYVETIANGIDCLDYGTSMIYSYYKESDGENYDFYYVYDGEDEMYYCINNYDYSNSQMVYWSEICQFDELSEDGATFNYAEENGTMTFTISKNGKVYATLVATKSGDTISEASYTIVNEEGSNVITYVYTYGDAVLSEPDLSNFENRSN